MTTPRDTPDAEARLHIAIAPEVSASSWLNQTEWRWLRDAYDYARTQTSAIPALAKLTPEEAANTHLAMSRAGHYTGEPTEMAGEAAMYARLDRLAEQLPHYTSGDVVEMANVLATFRAGCIATPEAAARLALPAALRVLSDVIVAEWRAASREAGAPE